MASRAMNEIRAVGDDLTITRFFAHPRERVFRVFGDGGWWGPDGFICTEAVVDAVVGGAWRGTIRNEADGAEYGFHGVYREIVEPERLVYTFIWDDPGPDTPDHVSVVTVNFAEVEGGTLMTFHQTPFISERSRDSHGEGWSQAFDGLERMLDAA